MQEVNYSVSTGNQKNLSFQMYLVAIKGIIMTQMDKYTPLHFDTYPFNYKNLKQNKMSY